MRDGLPVDADADAEDTDAQAHAAIARLVGLSRKSLNKALEPARDVA